jgi:hypothetical protein
VGCVKRRVVWGAVAVATAVSAGVVVVQIRDAPGSTSEAKGPGEPVVTHVRSTVLGTDDSGRVSLIRRDVEPFSMLRVSWDDPQARLQGAVEARVHAVGTQKWSSWETLEADGGGGEDAPRKGMRGATDPAWFGPSDGVEIRVAADDTLPDGLRLDVVDPGASPQGDMEAAAYVLAGESPEPGDTPSAPVTSSTSPSETLEPTSSPSTPEDEASATAAPTETSPEASSTATSAAPSGGRRVPQQRGPRIRHDHQGGLHSPHRPDQHLFLLRLRGHRPGPARSSPESGLEGYRLQLRRRQVRHHLRGPQGRH